MALTNGDSNITRDVNTKSAAYGMPVNDAATGIHPADTTSNAGLVSLDKMGDLSYPITEQARFSAGERNESIQGGFKLTQ